jgi:hypothetical protein
VYFLDEPVQLLEPNVVATFLAAVDTLPSRPQLIVLDTLALCMAGSDEGTGDMSTAIEAMRFIRRQTGATIVAQHHTRLDAERERGSTNLRGGVETMISLKREGQSITVACEKQKDAAKFSPLTLELIEVRDSCALITAQTGDAVSVLFPSDPRHQALRILHESSLADGLSTTAWLKASGMKDRTFYKARKQLVTMGYVDSAKGRGGMNRVTGQGELAL